MSESKMKKITFGTSLPRGACATFVHEGELWFAYPQDKITAVAAVLDRTIGVVDRVHDDLVRWINERPEDAAKVVAIMARTIRAKELARDKARAWTMKQKSGLDDENPTTEISEKGTDRARGDSGRTPEGA